MTTTFERLRAILVKDYKLEPAKLTLDAPLEDLGIDSLGVAELLFNVEDEFQVKLPPEPVLLPTVGDVVRYIDELVAAQRGQDVAPAASEPASGPTTGATVPARSAASAAGRQGDPAAEDAEPSSRGP